MGKFEFNLPFIDGTFNVHTDQDLPYVFPNVISVFRNILKSDSICLDVGAHSGLYSLIFSQIATHGHTYSFEPAHSIYNLLTSTINDNNLINVTPINKGIFNENAEVNFCNIENGSGSSHIYVDNNHEPNQLITCVKLDDWVITEKLNTVDFIKMDIEGSEIKALEGAQHTINNFHPDLVIEFNSYSLANMGHKPEEFFYLLEKLYPEIYLIQSDSSLLRINNYSQLIESTDPLKEYYNINYNSGDLYCTFKSTCK